MRTSSLRWRAFSLVELLTVIGIIALILGILLPALSAARKAGLSIRCLAQLQQIGQAVTMYTQQSGGLLPRSSHSAFANNCDPWGRAIMPSLGYGVFIAPTGGPRWTALFNGPYHCPGDRRTGSNLWSYGKNVYPELSAAETGGPTWAKVTQIPRPSATVFICEVDTDAGADHVMCNYWWTGAAPEIAKSRHGRTQNYLFVDGHAQAMTFDQTWNPTQHIDLWNPLTAR